MLLYVNWCSAACTWLWQRCLDLDEGVSTCSFKHWLQCNRRRVMRTGFNHN
jgi:hypothetical protein